MNQYANEIREMMESAEMSSIGFVYHNNKPRIQKDGVRYEILDIYAPDEDGVVYIYGIPDYVWRLAHLSLDDKSRASSWRHLRDIVAKEIERLGRDE